MPHLGDEAGSKPLRMPRDAQHAAAAMANGVEGNGEGNEEPPTRPKRVKPYRGRMRGPRIHENGITGPGVVLATVALDDGDVGQVAQILAGPGGQVWWR